MHDPNPFWPCGEAQQRKTEEMYLNRPGYFEDQVEPQLLELTAVIMQGPEARRAIVRRICRGVAHDAVQILADKIRDELRSHVEHCDACVQGGGFGM